MKYFVKLFVVTSFLIISTYAYAEQKIVVLDLKYVLNSSKAGITAQEYLKKQHNNNIKEFTELEKKLKEDETKLLEAKKGLSKEDYKKSSDELRKKVITYQTKRRSSLETLGKKRAELKTKLMDKLKPIVDAYIEENQISIVIDKKFMLGGLTEFDITNLITDKLNKELPSISLQ